MELNARIMKRLTLFVMVTVLLLMTTCEKSEFRQDLTGTWEIFGSAGGIAGQGASYDFDLMLQKPEGLTIFSRSFCH